MTRRKWGEKARRGGERSGRRGRGRGRGRMRKVARKRGHEIEKKKRI